MTLTTLYQGREISKLPTCLLKRLARDYTPTRPGILPMDRQKTTEATMEARKALEARGYHIKGDRIFRPRRPDNACS